MGLTQKLGTIPLAIFTDSSNNVGIGAAANASFKLQVTGATNLTGALTASTATFESSGSGNTFLINHTSGSGIALTITKGGNGEGLIINKTSGSGNALSVTGTTSLGGALSGTSATFSGNLNLQAGATRNINFYDSSNTNINAQIQYDQLTSNSGQLLFGTNNAGTFATRLTIANTGAATFSSSVTANGLLDVNGNATLVANFNYSANGTYVRWQNNGTSFGDIGSAAQLVTGGATNDFAIHARSTYNMVFATNFTERMRITSGGVIQFNGGYFKSVVALFESYTSTAYSSLMGTLSIGNSYNQANTGDTLLHANASTANASPRLYCASGANGVYLTFGATSWTANSDETIKDIIEPITNANDKLKDLRTIVYKLKEDEEGVRRIGLIAQDVEKVLPELVTKGFQTTYNREILGLNYTDLIPILIKAIQEQQAQIEELSNKIVALELK
jgi:hypothetical protein